MADLEKFRADVAAWIAANAPASLRGKASDAAFQSWGGRRPKFGSDDARVWLERAVERGFTAPAWPKEYGGAGLAPAEAKIVDQEIARAKLPVPLTGFGLTMIGPTLLQFGSEELRREHLPRITRGEIRWCQGYSEPNAGSDLASLQCSAVRDGDAFLVNGQKTWTSYGDLADWMFVLVRTDPGAKKQQGITFILVDLATRGVTIKPIRLISGASPFCETFLENVRIPVKNVVHEINQGWTVAKALLGHERTMIASVFGAGQRSRQTDRVVDIARKYVGGESGPLRDPLLCDRIAQLLLDQTCFELTMQRSRDGAKAGHRPGPETSFFKVYGTELNQRRQELLVALSGEGALGWEGESYGPDELQLTRDWLRSRGNTIEGGTSEVQLNIIAKRVLISRSDGTMDLVLNEDQTMLASTAKDFVESTTPLARLRKLREDGSGLRYSPEIWARMVELGWTALPFSEEDGGLGLGIADAAVVAEALGRLLAPEPFVETVVLAGRCLSRGSKEQKSSALAALIAGDGRTALAHTEEGARADLRLVRTRAARTESGHRITGEKTPVLGSVGAKALLVPARTSGEDRDEAGITLFLVPADAPGLTVTPLTRVDGRNAAKLTLSGVEVPASAVVGGVGGGFALLSAAVDDATVALSAEMLGGMTSAFERTVQYLKEREQFGVKIGSFQALQHRAARLFVEIELTRSAVMAAARALDEGAANARELVSIAKARASDAFVLVANEAIQMHGGIGMTDEHDIGFFLKRAKVAEITFGDAAFHRERFARLRGF